MKCVVQRVQSASVTVDGRVVGEIGEGMLVLAAVERGDAARDINWTAARLVGLRIFRNGPKHFDLDLKQSGGAMLLVSNFTVAAATRYGRRPSLDGAAAPEEGRRMFDELVRAVRASGIAVCTGEFGADMQVRLVNDGPATFLVQSRETPAVSSAAS